MKKQIVILLASLICGSSALADWVLDSSEVKYTVFSLLHNVDGISKEAKGKGICNPTFCEFLVAAPIKSFNSGNTNRDEHVLEVVRAGLNPMVLVRFKTPTQLKSPLTVEAEVELAGEKVKRTIPLNFEQKEATTITKGELKLKLTEFKVEPPSLIGFTAKDDFVVQFTGYWKK